MKLQPASRKEVMRIAVGSTICAAAEIVGLLILSILGIGRFSFATIIGAVGGTVIAITNFALMCLMVQNAAGIRDEKLMRAKVQGSYNFRMLFQAAWILIAFLVSWINVVAAVIPLIFPNLVIYYLQISGKLFPPSDNTPRQSDPEADERASEDIPGPFEV